MEKLCQTEIPSDQLRRGIDTERGLLFYKIEGERGRFFPIFKTPQIQQVVYKTFHEILNVCRVISDDQGRWYSEEPELQSYEKVELSVFENVDMLIYKQLTGDCDHHFFCDKFDLGENIRHKNILASKKGEFFALFDFDEFEPSYVSKQVKLEEFDPISAEAAQRFKTKVSLLFSQFDPNGNGFLFFYDIWSKHQKVHKLDVASLYLGFWDKICQLKRMADKL